MHCRFPRGLLALVVVLAMAIAPAAAFAAPPSQQQPGAPSGIQIWMSWIWTHLAELNPFSAGATFEVTKTTTSDPAEPDTNTQSAAPPPPPPDPPSDGGDTTPGIDPDG